MKGEAPDFLHCLLTAVSQGTGYKYFDMGYLSTLHQIFILTEQGHH
jgi:hypothetical protein